MIGRTVAAAPIARRLVLTAGVAAIFSASWPAQAGAFQDFFLGIELDRPAIVAPLLAKGFDVNARSAEGQHGLYVALREQSNEVVELLLKQPGLDANATNAAGETLLMMAALRGHLGAMRRLIALGAEINREGWTPLHYAASGVDNGAAVMLLDLGARIDALAPSGNTPLMMAAGFGNIDTADLLARRGADVSLQNKAGLRAADYARKADRDALAARLDALEKTDAKSRR